MNTRLRFYRVVVGASLGALLWAACSSPGSRMATASSGNNVQPESVPVSFEKRDVVTEVLKVQRELRIANEWESIGNVSAEFDLGNYRNKLVQKTCLLLHQD